MLQGPTTVTGTKEVGNGQGTNGHGDRGAPRTAGLRDSAGQRALGESRPDAPALRQSLGTPSAAAAPGFPLEPFAPPLAATTPQAAPKQQISWSVGLDLPLRLVL